MLNNYQHQDYYSFYPYHLGDARDLVDMHALYGRGGHVYSKHGLGLSLLVLPSFALGQGPNDLSGPWHCRFGSYHPGICQFVFADGHVATISNTIDMPTLQALAVINDGQVPTY